VTIQYSATAALQRFSAWIAANDGGAPSSAVMENKNIESQSTNRRQCDVVSGPSSSGPLPRFQGVANLEFRCRGYFARLEI